MQNNNTSCFCGNSKSYQKCCGLVHQNIFEAKTAEQLMRSRYSAFVLANGDYLQKSHSSKTRPKAKAQKELILWTKSVDWVKLEIIKSEIDKVEFKAFFLFQGKLDFIHEKSLFIQENGHWVYFGVV